MKRILSACAVMTAGIALVAAPPASAATRNVPQTGAGYVVSLPGGLHKAAVTVTVPRLSCASTSPKRIVRLGLFAGQRPGEHARPTSLFVRARCKAGSTTYDALYRGPYPGTVRVHEGDQVRLTLVGSNEYAIDDLTTGRGEATGSSGPATLYKPLLIGVQTAGPATTNVRAVFADAKVNKKPVSGYRHRRVGRTDHTHVSMLTRNGFVVRLDG